MVDERSEDHHPGDDRSHVPPRHLQQVTNRRPRAGHHQRVVALRGRTDTRYCNGAGSRKNRKAGSPRGGGDGAHPAAMEPVLERTGKLSTPSPTSTMTLRLQWSRFSKEPESALSSTPRHCQFPSCNGAGSRKNRKGRGLVQLIAVSVAAMEPVLERTGKSLLLLVVLG